MKFWTIQHIDFWNMNKEKEYLEAAHDYIFEEFSDHYLWMMKQMAERLENYSASYPIWLWVKRPDLRCNGHLERGEQGVLLEVELSEEEVLISDFMAWHVVLNNGFLAFTEEEDCLFEKGLGSMTKEESWNRIFDYKELNKYEYWKGEEDLQAVTGRIKMTKVRLIKEFRAK